MTRRIGWWAIAGVVVAATWGAIAMSSHAPLTGAMRTLVDITCPIAMLGKYPLSIYLVLAANALTYALVGLCVESLRRVRAH
jgi:hypothetical protein